jgi:S-formylglutathione hydrolase FrmB
LLSPRQPASGFLSPGFGTEAKETWIAAREVDGIMPGQAVGVDSDETVFPSSFSLAPPGDYYVMAMLDVNHSAAHRFFSPGNLRMNAVLLKSFKPRTTSTVRVTLDLRVAPEKTGELPAGMEQIDFTSPSLSRFYGRPIEMHAVVVLPPSYATPPQQAQEPGVARTPEPGRFPTVYLMPGFGATLRDLRSYGSEAIRQMADGRSPEMIYVLLDMLLPTGAHEFADSVNNGPWGEALVRELIPHLESRYRMQGEPGGRFLTGHSSGGWSSLWLQVTYPDFFGGTWPTSPDPVDFRNFTGPDIAGAKPGSNFYFKPDGEPWMLVRMGGKEVESLRDYARQERTLGQYGGQFASFEWVFSPRGAGGRPMQLFDRATGAIDPAVAAAWEKYDIARILRDNWDTLGPKLKGKIHIFVGTADSFHLESSVQLLEQDLKRLGSDAQFTYLPGRTHFDLYCCGLSEEIAREMYKRARH